MDYRSLPRIANSDLTEFKNKLLFGIEPNIRSSQALQFGTRFHDLLLLNVNTEPTGTGATATKRMLAVMRSNNLFNRVLAAGLAEQPQFWDDEQTGLACKARIDLRLPTEALIVDVKTTSATCQRDFEVACRTYEYDRQAAFYLDGCYVAGASLFVILGIQKQKPHQLFVVEAQTDSLFIEYGRKKYRALLRSWKQQPYRPTSWGH